MADLHHTQLCASLRRHHAAIGGPTSLRRFLTAAEPTIAPLLAHGVRWAWIAPRIDAVRAAPNEDIAANLPDASPTRVHQMRTAYSSARTRRSAPARHDVSGPNSHVTPPPSTRAERGHDPPQPAGARGRIHSAADRLKTLGKLES